MSRLSRFLRLERARPVDASAPATSADPAPQRFAAIEPRKAPPAAAPDDPFAPPPEMPVELQLDLDPGAAVTRAKAERKARVEAALVAAREHALEAERRREAQPVPVPDQALAFLVRLGTGGRLLAIGAILLATVILADLVSPAVWVVSLLLIGGIAASFLATKA